VKARPLDNLEFLQWMKHYHDTATNGQGCGPYNAAERRDAAKGGLTASAAAPAAAPAPAGGKKRPASAGGAAQPPAAPGARSTANISRPGRAAPAPAAAPAPKAGGSVAASAAPQAGALATATAAASAAQVKALSEQVAKLRLDLQRCAGERDFYFDKLSEIELLCQRPIFAGLPMVGVIQRILYAVDGIPDVEADVRAVTARMLAGEGQMEDAAGQPTDEHQPSPSPVPGPSPMPLPMTDSPTLLAAATTAAASVVQEEQEQQAPQATPPPKLCDSPLTCAEPQPGMTPGGVHMRTPLSENRSASLPVGWVSRIPSPRVY
jgi:RP/EB family microtubule-associated protein